MGHKMRVILAGYDNNKINGIAITTMLNGLYTEYGDKLCVIFYGSGHISDIVEEWVHKRWPGPSSKNCFNLAWVIEHWSGDDSEGVGPFIVEEAKPDLAFLFGYDQYKIHRALRNEDVPTFVLEKL